MKTSSSGNPAVDGGGIGAIQIPAASDQSSDATGFASGHLGSLPSATYETDSQQILVLDQPLDLSAYQQGDWSPGRSLPVRALWYFVSQLMFENGFFPLQGLKIRVLRLFGARIGQKVVLKPNVRIKFPWRLEIGDHCWIGEGVWIDNLAEVRIGDHCCLSQGAYFCTGSHDHRRHDFRLITRPIEIGNSVWICCRATLLPGAEVADCSVVRAGSVIRPAAKPRNGADQEIDGSAGEALHETDTESESSPAPAHPR